MNEFILRSSITYILIMVCFAIQTNWEEVSTSGRWVVSPSRVLRLTWLKHGSPTALLPVVSFSVLLHLYIEGLRKGTCVSGCFWWRFEHAWWKCTGCGHCRVTWSLRRVVVVDWNIWGIILTLIIIAVEKRTKICFRLDFVRRNHRRTIFGILI